MEHYFDDSFIGRESISEISEGEFLMSFGNKSFESTWRDKDTLIVPDIHGDLTALKNCLKKFQLIDEAGNWIGEDARVVFVGDLIDRGGEDRAVLDFVIDLKKEVPRHGGEVVVLAGNHEMFWINTLFGDCGKDASVKGMMRMFNRHCERLLGDFGLILGRSSLYTIRKRFETEGGGKYVDFLRDLKVFYQFDDVLVVHGGVSPNFAKIVGESGIEFINKKFIESYGTGVFETFNKVSKDRGGMNQICEVSPFWFDHSFYGDGSLLEDEEFDIYSHLKILGVNLVVSGHQADYEPRCITYTDLWGDDPLRFICVDTGMTRGFGNVSTDGGMMIDRGHGGAFKVSDCNGGIFSSFDSMPRLKKFKRSR